MSDLAAFQREFSSALHNRDRRHGATVQPAFDVYVNTVFKGAIDALTANYPTVLRLMGAEAFLDIGRRYVRDCSLCSPVLADCGKSFPDFLVAQGFRQELCDVARIDRFRVEAHLAADGESLSAAIVARLTPDALMDLKLELHPSARIAAFESGAVFEWFAHQPEHAAENRGGHAILVNRMDGAVAVRIIARAAHRLLELVSEGYGLLDAGELLVLQHPDAGLEEIFLELLACGVFCEKEE